MKRDREEELSKALRAADPAVEDDLRGWAESEGGQRVYARILALRDKESGASPARTTDKKAFRLALAAVGVVVLIAVVVVVAVAVGTREPSGQLVESTSTSAIAPMEGVDRLVALAAVVRAVEGIRGASGPQLPQSPVDDAVPYLERAESLGIILPAERDTLVASGSISRGVYALWVWRAFADLLAQVREVDFLDLGALSQDMREAITGVAGAGIIDGRSNERFEANQPLTVEEEQQASSRLEKALGLSKDTAPSR